ncbi:amidohydrolase family protein [candidate division KSB1 bacterium]|nr:amidohydrolase family protein [candidate division KSB1 bacterium]
MRMKTSLSFLCVSLLILSAIISLPTRTSAQDLVIRGGWLFDSVSDNVVRNSGIVIKSGKFIAVGGIPDRDLTGFETLELQYDDYILPGMFDLHAHYRVTFNGIRKDEHEVNPIIFLANGVTSTFPNGEINPYEMMEARKRIDRGEQIGARLFNSGPYFGTSRANRGWSEIKTPEDVYADVDKWAELGVKGFKAKGINPELLQALIDRAHMHGLPVTGHLGSGARNSVNPRDAILMGIDRIEHFLGGDVMPASRSAYASLQDLDPYIPELDNIIQLYIDNNVYFDATLTAYGYYGDRAEGFDYWVDERKYLTPYAFEITKETRQSSAQFDKIYKVKRKTIKRYFDAGGLISLGTDHPSVGEYIPGFSAHREMDAFVLSGIPPADAIKIATINGARALRMGDILGSIEVGKLGDLFVTKGNPLQNIRNTRNVHTVVKGGKVYDTQELLKSVEGKLGPKNAEDWKK